MRIGDDEPTALRPPQGALPQKLDVRVYVQRQTRSTRAGGEHQLVTAA
jgi:hypothetical protein